MANFDDLKKYRKVHMIGIGGVSMSGIAEILKNWGFTVTGSDRTRSEITDKLIEDGIHVEIGHNPDLVNSADLVVYTAAIKEDDPIFFMYGDKYADDEIKYEINKQKSKYNYAYRSKI